MCGGSQNAKRMIDTICSLFPFPRVLHLSFKDDGDWAWCTAMFLSRIAFYFMKQGPAEVHITVEYVNDSLDWSMIWVIYLPNLKTQTMNSSKQPLSGSNEADDPSNFTSLSALTLPVESDVTGYTVVKDYQTTSTTLEKVTFTLIAETGEGCSRALDELSANLSFSSMGLKINASLSQSATVVFRFLTAPFASVEKWQM